MSRRREDRHPTASIQTPASANPPIQSERPLKRPRRDQRDVPYGFGRGPSGLDAGGTRLIERASRSSGRVPRSGRRACAYHRRVSASLLGGSVNLSTVSQEEEEFHNLRIDPMKIQRRKERCQWTFKVHIGPKF